MATQSAMKTTGDVRKYLASIALAVVHGEVKVQEAAVAVKACKEIHASLYSEIKAATIQVQLGREAAELGDLPLAHG